MAKREPAIERRFAPLSEVEVRADLKGGIVHFRGHAAVFNELTDIAGLFRERIAPGTFTKTLKDGADVRFLWNHNPDTVMARTKSGTLEISEDAEGLDTRADLDSGDWDVQRIVPKMQRGDVTQMSFAFRAIKDDWEDSPQDGGSPIRTLREVQLFDVSPVTFPAYEGTDAELVSIRALAEVDERVKHLIEEKQDAQVDSKEDVPEEDKVSPDEDREENASTQAAASDKPEPPEALHLAEEASLRRQLQLVTWEKRLREEK